MPIRPPHLLSPGDTVALVGPASPLKTEAEVLGAMAAVEALGLRVKAYPSARAKFDYLAGTDKQRAADLNRAIADEKIAGIFCIRGGYGSSRLLALIDWKAAGKSRKPFLGFSDLTSIIGGLHSQAGLVGIHAPTAAFFLKHPKEGEPSTAAIRKFIFEGWGGTSYRKLCGSDFAPRIVKRGQAEGVLVGGNLSLFAGLVGTPYLPKPRRAILFLEEIHEKPYKLDRYITQLVNAGFFKNVVGIALGDFTDCDPVAPDTGTSQEVLANCLKPLGVPILAGLPIGHCRPSYPLPLGVTARLDATRGDLVLA